MHISPSGASESLQCSRAHVRRPAMAPLNSNPQTIPRGTCLLHRPAPLQLGSGANYKSRRGCMAINILHKGSCGDNHRAGLNKEGTGGIMRFGQAGLRAQSLKLRLRLG